MRDRGAYIDVHRHLRGLRTPDSHSGFNFNRAVEPTTFAVASLYRALSSATSGATTTRKVSLAHSKQPVEIEHAVGEEKTPIERAVIAAAAASIDLRAKQQEHHRDTVGEEKCMCVIYLRFFSFFIPE